MNWQHRFMCKVAQVDACWMWTGARSGLGYGRVNVGGKNRMAHRAFWEHLNGPVPDGLELDHLCRNRACVNPDHLEPVTHRENVLRSPLFVGHRTGPKAVCGRGHAQTPDNRYTPPSGVSRCLECLRINTRVQNAKKAQHRCQEVNA